MAQAETLIRYAPVVRGNSETIGMFRCKPVFRSADGQEFGIDMVLGHKGDIENTAQRNAAILRIAFKALVRARAQGHEVQLVLPVNSVALASRAGATIIHDVFAELDVGCRAGIIVEVFNLPERVSVDSLSEITIPMLPYTHVFLARPHPAMEDFTVFANCNYQGVAYDLGTHSQNGQDAQDRLDHLTDFWAETTKRRLGLCVHDLADADTLNTLRRWEARFIDGPVIGAAAARPGPVSTVKAWAQAHPE